MTTEPGASLVESDRRYFELAAQVRALPGARLAWLEGLTSLPAAGVVHRVDPAVIDEGTVDDWPALVADAQREVGMRLGRVYLDGPAPALEAALAAHGWEARDEIGFAALDPVDPRYAAELERTPVDGDEAWAAKLTVHAACTTGPDGHDAPAELWVAMERARAASDELALWLFRREGVVVATVGTLRVGAVLRNKNVVVHPDHRRRTVALGVLAHLDAMARAEGRVVATFAVAGEAGERLYRAAGMAPVVVQREWSRPL